MLCSATFFLLTHFWCLVCCQQRMVITLPAWFHPGFHSGGVVEPRGDTHHSDFLSEEEVSGDYWFLSEFYSGGGWGWRHVFFCTNGHQAAWTPSSECLKCSVKLQHMNYMTWSWWFVYRKPDMSDFVHEFTFLCLCSGCQRGRLRRQSTSRPRMERQSYLWCTLPSPIPSGNHLKRPHTSSASLKNGFTEKPQGPLQTLTHFRCLSLR